MEDLQVETKAEVLEGNRAKVTVTIDSKTVSERFKKQYKEFANRYNFPGFRRGKAPRPVINNMLGKEYVEATITDSIVNETCPLAIDQTDLYPIGQADFPEDMGENLAADGKDFTYTFEIEIKPEIELTSYEPVEIELPSEEVTDEEVETEINAFRDHYFLIVNCNANTKVKKDNYVDMTVKATDDHGKEIESMATTEQYGLGTGVYPATFDDELIGMKKGETKEFTIDTPAEATLKTGPLMGKTATITFEVTINAVQKREAPELTDEWVKEKIGLESVDELRSEVRDSFAETKAESLPALRESRALTALAERLDGEVPEGMVEENESSLLQDFFRQLQRQGATLDAYLKQQGITSQQFRDDIKNQAKDITAQDLALDAWAKYFEFEATAEDISEEFVKSGAPDPAAIEAEWRANGQIYMVRQGVLRQKAADDVVKGAVVTEEKPAEDAE